MLVGLPRGNHLSPWAKQDLRTLFEYAKAKNLPLQDQLFEIRFGIELEDDWSMNDDPEDIDTLWKLLRDLPDTSVEGNTKIHEIVLSEGQGGGLYNPETFDISIGSEELTNREKFEDVMRHEVGHAVHEMKSDLVNDWLESRFGWRIFGTNDADIDQWVGLMGGWGTLSGSERADVRQYLRTAAGGGGSWQPGPPPAAPAGHPWYRSNFGPRLAFERSGAYWFQNYVTWYRRGQRAFFMNFWYRTFMAVDTKTLELVAKMPDAYASMSHFEFFAELYSVVLRSRRPQAFCDSGERVEVDRDEPRCSGSRRSDGGHGSCKARVGDRGPASPTAQEAITHELPLARFGTVPRDSCDADARDPRLASPVGPHVVSPGVLTVSLAMLGMAAGAVLVFVGGERYTEQRAIRELPRITVLFALAIPLMHMGNLSLPIPLLEQFRVREVGAIVIATIILGLPFLLAGVAVTLALTRSGGSTSRLYAADLLGAALGCLLVVPLLDRTNITSVGVRGRRGGRRGRVLFRSLRLDPARSGHYGRSPRRSGDRRWFSVALCLGFLAAAALNAVAKPGIGVVYAKNRIFRGGATAGLNEERVEWSAWNTHSYIVITPSFFGPAFYWGPGRGADQFHTTSAWILIDADAGTPITKWDGNTVNLGWVSYDVTTLPYHLRKGNAGIIGVGVGAIFCRPSGAAIRR